jgi:undecaprenyl-diphosphatase
MIAYFFYRYLKKWKHRQVVLWVAPILIVLVGFSRIYLGVHYLSDVLAGFLLGALWVLLGISLVEMMAYRRNRLSKQDT